MNVKYKKKTMHKRALVNFVITSKNFLKREYERGAAGGSDVRIGLFQLRMESNQHIFFLNRIELC